VNQGLKKLEPHADLESDSQLESEVTRSKEEIERRERRLELQHGGVKEREREILIGGLITGEVEIGRLTDTEQTEMEKAEAMFKTSLTSFEPWMGGLAIHSTMAVSTLRRELTYWRG
jgi:hypothetical protein